MITKEELFTIEPSGEGLKSLRNVLNLSALKLGKLLDVAPETISRWENGKVPIPKLVWLTLLLMVYEYYGYDSQLTVVGWLEKLGKWKNPRINP